MNTLTAKSAVLPYKNKKALLLEFLLLTCAVFLPALCHRLGINTLTWLPMHWPVLAGALVYGWRTGAFLGVTSVLASFIFSGMPPAAVLPLMAVELTIYGFAAGFLREVVKLNAFTSLAIALAAGRIWLYFAAGAVSALAVPGVLAQLVFLPLIAAVWTKKLQ